MWDKLRRQFDRKNRSGELYYATHHHLIPIYTLLGITLVALIVMASFVSVMWQNTRREENRATAGQVVRAVSDQYLPTTVNPTEKRQYIYSANVRFPVTLPSDTFLYAYDPGLAATRTSTVLTLTTHQTLQNYADPIGVDPDRATAHLELFQRCHRLYIIRFEPGLVPDGNFALLKEVKLRDGRTAYVHKNANCVPSTTGAMNELDAVEQAVSSIESY